MRNLGYKTFLFTLIFYSQSVCCQTMSLNGALECAYNNFLGKVMPNNRYAEYGFYIVRNYNPYGFNFRFLKDDLASHLVTLKTAKLDSGLKKGKNYIGYPYFSVIGKDTLCINIGQKTYDKEGRITFTDGYVTGFCSDCSVNTFKELNISRGKMTALLGYAEEKGRVIVFDSIYVKALIDAIKQIQAGDVPLCDIYIDDVYFPNWLFKTSSLLKNFLARQIHIISLDVAIPEDGSYILGWPQVIIRRGYIKVRIYCKCQEWTEMKSMGEATYTYDENANRWRHADR